MIRIALSKYRPAEDGEKSTTNILQRDTGIRSFRQAKIGIRDLDYSMASADKKIRSGISKFTTCIG